MKKTIGIIFLFGVLTLNLYKTFNFLWADITVIGNFPRLNYDQKMHVKYNSFYDFMVFVRANTPDDAEILIPPDMAPWSASGNSFLVNYFLYPRRLINGDKKIAPNDFKKFSYVLAVWKDFEEKGLENVYGWPKFLVPAEEVYYMATTGPRVDVAKRGNYLPADPLNTGRYSLIKL